MKLSFKKLNEIPKFIWLAFTSTYLRYSKLGCHSNLSKHSYRNRCLHCTLLLVTSPYLICFTSITTFLLFYCTTHTSLVSIMEGASKQIWRGRDRKKNHWSAWKANKWPITWRNTFVFCSTKQLPHLRFGPLTSFMRCILSYRNTRTPSGVVC